MSLILAIESDRRQVAQLINIVRQRVGAELILADTTERALESIGSRIPDLILAPALLSPQDDAALAAALRVIATAAHVQMLTIPTFATVKPRQKSRGVLSAFRRSAKTETPLDGCDPGVFAEQISSYLERANEERAAAQALDDDAAVIQANPFPESAQAFDEPPATFDGADAPVYAESWTATTSPAPQDPALVQEVGVEVETDALLSAPALDEPLFERAAAPEGPAEPWMAATGGATQGDDAHADIDLGIEAEVPPAMALDEFVATLEQADAPPVTPATALEFDEANAEAELLAIFERTDLPVIEEVRAEQWMAAAVEPEAADEDKIESDQVDIDLSTELEALEPFEPVVPVERFEPFPLAAWQSWPHLEGTGSEAHQQDSASDNTGNTGSFTGADDPFAEFEAVLQTVEPLERFEPLVPVQTFEPLPLAAWQCWPRLEGVVAEAYEEPIAPRKAVARPEWVELMRSLREDIARRRTELAQPVQAVQSKSRTLRHKAAAAQPAPAAEPQTKRPKRTRPIEDEWGLFDPEQCGFAALLDKLDEITVPPPSGQQPRRQA